jgi:hypothetical protein
LKQKPGLDIEIKIEYFTQNIDVAGSINQRHIEAEKLIQNQYNQEIFICSQEIQRGKVVPDALNQGHHLAQAQYWKE